jgi:hypothetical protein
MNTQLTIAAFTLLGALPFIAAAQEAAQNPFHFWFQRDGGCVACSKMPPPGKVGSFPQKAGIDVMFNGYNQANGKHWQNQNVQSYEVTYTYKLSGATHSAKQSAKGGAASVIVKPYGAVDLNNAQIVSITVAATYASGTVMKTAHSPVAFQLY